jgi:hypothetical protein
MINIALAYFVQNENVFLDDFHFIRLLRQGTQIHLLLKPIFFFSKNNFFSEASVLLLLNICVINMRYVYFVLNYI